MVYCLSLVFIAVVSGFIPSTISMLACISLCSLMLVSTTESVVNLRIPEGGFEI